MRVDIYIHAENRIFLAGALNQSTRAPAFVGLLEA